MLRILSGVQPTGYLHLGNYLGAIKNWVDFQDNYECFFCVVDHHAITIKQNPDDLIRNSTNIVAAYLACGIDPNKSNIFLQSTVMAHTELAWILSCNTPIGWLNRMTQFKEKSGKNKEKSPVGLFSYPILMAADILLYNASKVPVGEDQKQHLELTRDIANRFNDLFGDEIFIVPEPIIMQSNKRIMSLKDGTKKMSKSDISDLSRINLSDDRELIIKKIRKAKTDNYTNISEDLDKRPEIVNLLNIYASLANLTIEDAVSNLKNHNSSMLKDELILIFEKNFIPITHKFKEVSQDIVFLKKILKEGSQKANEVANNNLNKVKKIMGFLQF